VKTRTHPLLVVAAGMTLLGLPELRPESLQGVAPAAGPASTLRDSIVVMPPRRMFTEGYIPFRGPIDVPDLWRIEVRARSRRPHAGLVLVLSGPGSRVPARLSRRAAESIDNPGAGAPKRPIGESAYRDSLGCRFYPVKLAPEAKSEPDSLGFFDLVGSVTVDSMAVVSHTRMTAYGEDGNRAISVPLEAR
jgi:hypothetical protein